MKSKWRIVTDRYGGFEVQKRLWWWPVWYQPQVNTSHSLEQAQKQMRHLMEVEHFKSKVVYTHHD